MIDKDIIQGNISCVDFVKCAFSFTVQVFKNVWGENYNGIISSFPPNNKGLERAIFIMATEKKKGF